MTKIKCPFCGFIDFDFDRYSVPSWAIYHHFMDEHTGFDEHDNLEQMLTKFADVYFKIHENIEFLDKARKNNDRVPYIPQDAEAAATQEWGIQLLKSLLEDEK